MMIKREKYLEKIRSFYNEKSLIKIIYGIRRSGKSVLLSQIRDEIIEKEKVDNNHIIYIDFESLEYSNIKEALDLDKYIKSLVKDKKTYYIFLDEIQKVKDFEKALNSLRIQESFSIFVTGSNSRVTFSNLSTDLTGRYISFKVNPFSFKEAVLFTKTKKEGYLDLLIDIFKWGSLPQRFTFKDELSKLNYIKDVYNSIVLKDVVERLNIKDVNLFNNIFNYILDTETREFSPTNIQKYLKSNNREISFETLYSYLEALVSTFLINKVSRYDVHGKIVLKTLNKYYLSDMGIKNIKSNEKEINYSTSMENIVYNELLNKEYEVYIGKTKKGEVDFIAKKNGDLKYIQVTSFLNDEKTIKREFEAFEEIKDNFPKYLISMDKENKSQNGIIHLNIVDFLIDDDF